MQSLKWESGQDFAQGAYDTIVKGLDTILLLQANLGLGLDDVPKFKDIILDFLEGDAAGNRVTAGHFFDVRLQLADVLANNFGVNDVALGGDLSVRSGREGN